jgi:hypothetical protein
VCVGCLFFKDTEPSRLQDSFSVRQQGGLPGPPPRSPSVPHPESIDAAINADVLHARSKGCLLNVGLSAHGCNESYRIVTVMGEGN